VGQEQDAAGSARAAEGPETSAAGAEVADGPRPAAGKTAAEHAERMQATFAASTADTLIGRMGIKLLEASAERAVATMPVAGNTQPYGLLHGGASCVLAETLGSVASALHAGPDRITVGIEINATHHRGVSHGLVTAVATRVHGGSTLTTYEIVITDDRGRRVCTARLSCLLRDLAPGRGPGPAGASGPSARDV
jgi:1,4-dihydroxy-2-naphthoyl-CoA hydrolase